MRVVAGTVGGRKLQSPTSAVTRPTSDRVREATFNALNSLGVVEGAVVVDLFAGTGACGIEALSRGAASATFVDNDRRAIDIVMANLATTGLTAKVIRADVETFLNPSAGRSIPELDPAMFDLAFIDPPYAFDRWSNVLDHLNAAVAVCESNRPIEPGDHWRTNWRTIRTRCYGGTIITMLEQTHRRPE